MPLKVWFLCKRLLCKEALKHTFFCDMCTHLQAEFELSCQKKRDAGLAERKELEGAITELQEQARLHQARTLETSLLYIVIVK